MGKTSTVKVPKLANPEKVSKDQINAITRYLGRLADLDEGADLTARAVTYVIDGTDDEVLLKLGGLKKATAEELRLGNLAPANAAWELTNKIAQERHTAFRPTGSTAPLGAWRRLAEV